LVVSFSRSMARRISRSLRRLVVLHGERRGALRDAAGLLVGDEGPDDALRVDAAVLVEPGVLGRHDRLLHPGRDLGERDVASVLLVEGGDQGGAVGGVDVAGLRGRGGEQVGRGLVDQLRAGLRGEAAGRGEGEQCRGHDDAADESGAEEGYESTRC